MKKILLILVPAVLVFACKAKKNDNQNESYGEITQVTVANFKSLAPELVGKMVVIHGTADHICKHDGKKLFLIDVNSEGRVKVVTGEGIAAFDAANEGLDFKVTGIVEETIIDEDYLQGWEEELKAELSDNPTGEDNQSVDGKESEHHDRKGDYEQIAKYRQQMADLGVDKLSFYHIVAVKYEIDKE